MKVEVLRICRRKPGDFSMNRSYGPKPGLFLPIVYLLIFALPSISQAAEKPPKFVKENHLFLKAFVSPLDPLSDLNRADAPSSVPATFRRGESFYLVIKGTFAPGWHTYPLIFQTPKQDTDALSTLQVDGGGQLIPLKPIKESEPKLIDDGTSGTMYEHVDPFYWVQEVVVKPESTPGTKDLTIKVKAQVCNASVCTWENHELKVPVVISTESAVPLSPDLEQRLKAALTPPSPETPKDIPVVSKSETENTGFWGSLLTAISAGFLSLLTPCVFPMIPITVSYFLKQSESQPNKALVLASVYSLTIVLVLAAGGLILLRVLVDVSNHWVTNVVLATVFFVFGSSLLGMFDLALPAWLSNLTSAREDKGGLLGTFFMALTFSIISFTCVGPIYGGFLATEAAGQTTGVGGGWLQKVPGVLAFSFAFASPFFVLAMFPRLLRSLPKSGSWMNSVKVVLGFLELAAVFKFLRAAELGLTGKADYFSFDLVLGIWVALSFLCGLYLLNVYRLPHDHGMPDSIGVVRLLFSVSFIAIALYLLPGLFKTGEGKPIKQRGELFYWVESFLLPEITNDGWSSNLPDSLDLALRQKQLVFLDFTGLQCTNCKKNESQVFTQDRIKALFAKYVTVRLYLDKTPAGEIQVPDGAGARELEQETFRDDTQPLYAILRPLGGGKFDIIATYGGLIRDQEQFVRFLEAPLALNKK
jgi:thiol:disulfide interchange protein DsbD